MAKSCASVPPDDSAFARSWRGKLIFDVPRCEYPMGRFDGTRLNEMPQWFVARPEPQTEREGTEKPAGKNLNLEGSTKDVQTSTMSE